MLSTLDEKIIKRYCELFGYGYRHFGCNVIITTSIDEWRLELVREDLILVQHYNKAGNRTGKMQFHCQRYAQDLHYIFKNIINPHENYSGVYSEAFRIKRLLESV